MTTALANVWELLEKIGSFEKADKAVRSDTSLDVQALQCRLDILQGIQNNWRSLGMWCERFAKRIEESPSAGPGDFSEVLQAAETAVRLHRERCPDPDRCKAGWYSLNTLAIVQYRAGECEHALATLERGKALWKTLEEVDPLGNAGDVALRAMVYHKLGRLDAARAEFAQAQRMMAAPKHPDDVQELINEAQRIIAPMGN